MQLVHLMMTQLLQKLLSDRDEVVLLYGRWVLCSCGAKFDDYSDAENHLVKHNRRQQQQKCVATTNNEGVKSEKEIQQLDFNSKNLNCLTKDVGIDNVTSSLKLSSSTVTEDRYVYSKVCDW